MMKKAVLLSLILLFSAFFAPGCAKEADVVALDPGAVSDTPSAVVLTPFSGDGSGASAGGKTARAEVVSTAAYAYTSNGKTTLYGAAEYKNTGTADIVLSKAAFTFRADGGTAEHEFEPVLSQYDIVAPGESSFVTLWLTSDAIPAGTSVTLEVSLTCAPAEDARADMEVKNLFLADNYPKFTTMSGTLKNISASEYAFLMTYVGFYDESDSLLGVWYFTKNIRLGAGESTDFVTRMEDLPVNGLSESVKTMKTSAFGFNG